MRLRSHHIILFLSLTVSPTDAQDSSNARFPFDEGLTLEGGTGRVALRDEYISHDRYTGSIPSFGIGWSRSHETYNFRFQLEYQHSGDLKGPNVRAEVTRFRIGFAYLYPLAVSRLFSKTVYIFLGPSAELFEHYQRDQIAGTAYVSSNVAYTGGALRVEAFCPLTDDLQFHATGQCTILSIGSHSSPSSRRDESPVKLLSAFNGLDARTSVEVSWLLTPAFDISAGYSFSLTRVSAWDFFISAHDELTFALRYDL